MQHMLLKVQSWWREGQPQWLQILHDIMYLGQQDVTEGQEGDDLEQPQGLLGAVWGQSLVFW